MDAEPLEPEVKDGGPWQGPTLQEWLARLSPWPTPWIERPEVQR